MPLRSASVWKTQPDLVLVLAGQPTVVLFANDFALTTRTNVQLRISHTAGKTWSTVVPVSTGPAGGFSNGTRGVVAGYVDVVGVPVGAVLMFEDGGCRISAATVQLTANWIMIDHFSAFESGLGAPFLYAAG